MAKPIFVIKVPIYVGMQDFSTMMRSSIIEEMRPDYYCLFVKTDIEGFEFECFNAEDADEIKFDELQRKVLELANSK